MNKLKPLVVFALLLILFGCRRDRYYIQQCDKGVIGCGDYDYYIVERHPTTFHGICAHIRKAQTFWVVEHPWGHNAEGGSQDVEEKTFPTEGEALVYVKGVCPR